MELKRSLGMTVRQRRLELGISQVELAERMGADTQQSDVSRIERGFLPWPRPQLLHVLAIALEMSVLELITRSGWMTPGELEQYQSTRAIHSQQPLVLIGQRQIGDKELSLDLLSPDRFRVMTMFDGVTLLDTVRATAPALVMVHQELAALDLEELADAIWAQRLDTNVIVIGRRRTVPPSFHFLEAPATRASVEEILVAIGVE